MPKATIDENFIQLIWDSNEPHPIGTGFSFLRRDWIGTAKHVVDIRGSPRQNIEVEFPGLPRLKANVYAWHPIRDVAILRVLGTSPNRIPLLPAYAKFKGQEGLISAGYRPSLSDLGNRRYTLEVNHVKDWSIERRSRTESEEEVIVFRSNFVEPGHSGGPLIGGGGSVVGIVMEQFQLNGEPCARGTSILSLLDGLELQSSWQVKRDGPGTPA